jgi:hypothetical protein
MRNGLLPALALLAATAGPAAAQGPPVGPMPYGVPPFAPDGVEVSAEAAEPSEWWAALQEGFKGPCAMNGCRHGYASVEYLLWALKSGAVSAPLITSGGSGVVGSPGTTVLFGNDTLNTNPYSGVRFRGGLNFGREGQFALEVGAFTTDMERDQSAFQSIGTATNLLARPFTDLFVGPNAVLIAAPGVATGGVSAESFTMFFGGEANLTLNAYRSDDCRFDLISGYRYLNLQEELKVQSVSSIVNGPVPFGTSVVPSGGTIAVIDQVTTRNIFNGGNFGGRLSVRKGCWQFDSQLRLGLGSTHQRVELIGLSGASVVPAGPVVVAPGGVLVTPTNAGRFKRDEFAVNPEVALKAGYCITERLVVSVGYDFIYLSSVARPGDQFDQRSNVNLVPTSQSFATPGGGPVPAVLFDRTDFWAQGLSLGLTFQY